MNKLFSRLVSAITLATMLVMGLGSALPTAAATTNSLIKGSGSSTVYWYASNGMRYVYPNIKTFWSWHTSNDLNNVKTVSNSELASIQLGGNVTYRPGYRLVKSASNERVYAVARYGVLRWITNEQVARDFYGWDWNTKIDDVPDEFFSNYTIGNPIYNTADYNAGTEYNTVYNPNDNINGSQNGNNNGNSVTQNNVTVSVDKTTINSGDSTTVSASTSDSNSATFTIYDERFPSIAQKNCYNTNYCSLTLTNNRWGTETRFRYYVVVNRNGNSNTVYSPYVNFSGSNNNGNSVTQNNVTVSIDKTTINSGDRVNFTATASDSSYATFSMYDERTNALLQTCYNVGTCSTAQYVTRSTNNEATMRVYVVVSRNGNSTSLYSPYVSFNGSNNNSNNSVTQNNITVTIDRNSINSGEYVMVTATANDSINATYSMYDERNGTLLKTCSNTSNCVLSQAVYRNNNEASMRFYVVVNRNGNYTTVYSPYVSFTGSNNNTNNGFDNNTSVNASVTSRFNDTNGENIVFTANVVNPNTNVNNVTVSLYDQNNNQVLKTCAANTYCALTLNAWSQTTRTLYARAVDQTGRSIESSRVTVSYGNNGNTNVTRPTVTSPSQNQIFTNDNRQVTLNWSSSARRHEVLVECESCNSGSWTTVAQPFTDNYQTNYTVTVPNSNMQYRARVRVLNDNGQTSDWSDAVYFRMNPSNNNQNNGPFTANTIVTVDKQNVNVQQTLNLTANVSNFNVAQNALEISLYDERDNRLLGTCNGVVSCMVNTYVWRIDGQSNTFRYYAIVRDSQGHQLPWVYSPYVTLNN